MNGTVTEKKYIITNTIGLVLCGGNSSRMGTDKSMLQYCDKPQRYHVYDMLLPFCEHVFIAINEQQVITVESGYDHLTDAPAFNNIGPMAALLTAFTRYPQMNMLLIGCDYPFLSSADIKDFAAICKHEPAAFYNEAHQVYEPLLAWYPYQTFDELKKRHASKQYSLQHFLKDNNAVKFYPQNKNSMVSVDTEEAFTEAHKSINK
ncbi:MAG: molybdenum cofactor guanylyltransferase [Chitinophagaceae bacterium]|nr:molybdenum cofactor guanylyltransferase [Chitinophagaceae bacterium]